MDDVLRFFAAHHHALALAAQIAKLSVWFIVLIVIFVPLEQLFAVRPAEISGKSRPANVGWYFINGLSLSFLLGPIAALVAWLIHMTVPARMTEAAAALPFWARIIGALFVGEIGFYWGHRWTHEIPLLWRFHAVHHSATHLSFLVNMRAHPVDLIFTRLCGLVLLYATGLASPTDANSTLVPALVLLVGTIWSFVIHANLRWRLGPLEEIISSPAFHHWHHTYEDHKDHNYAAMLPIMDRLFGTFYLPAAWPTEYGTSTPMPDGLVGQFLEPFAPVPPASSPSRTETLSRS